MAELKCPHCGQAFTVDDTELSSIVKQIRDKEFEQDLSSRVHEVEKHMQEKHMLQMESQANQMKLQFEAQENRIMLKTREQYYGEIEKLKSDLRDMESLNRELKGQIEQNENKTKIAVMEAVKKVEDEKREIENHLANEHDKHTAIIAEKDAQIEFYKDLKTKMSTKMVGETLEQHCEIQFNQLRPTAFRNAYFEKDNDASSGSKGDYIYRDYDEEGTEYISIMFEMKNEMDTTATKHKNEDFFKELDKDRREKKCEYAVLVSLLEVDNELYNAGITDVSHRYEKMYVIRPQCFIPMITLLPLRIRCSISMSWRLSVNRI